MAEMFKAITLKVKAPPPITLNVNFKGEFLSSSDGEDYKRGYEEGHAQGLIDGRADGYKSGYEEGHKVGSESGYQTGKQDGIAEGYENGYEKGKSDGYEAGYDEGYQEGYEKGYEQGKAEGGLPDWDDDSPIVASGIGYHSTVTWELTEKGTMRWFCGTKGDPSFTAYHKAVGWSNTMNLGSHKTDYLKIAQKVKQLDIGEGFEYFYLGYATKCERIRLPQTMKDCIVPSYFCSLVELDLSQFDKTPSVSSGAFNLQKIILNTSVTEITKGAFQNCYHLREIDLGNITIFDNNCFMECGLCDKEIVFSNNLIKINGQAFYRTHIKSITFQQPTGDFPTIANSAFSQCNNLTDIYCPWVEGAVANAPWGATKATIHYNAEV